MVSTAPGDSPWTSSADGGSPCWSTPSTGGALWHSLAHRWNRRPLPIHCLPPNEHRPRISTESDADTDTVRGCWKPVVVWGPAQACVGVAVEAEGRSYTWEPWNNSPDLCSCNCSLSTRRADPVAGNRTAGDSGAGDGTAEARVAVTWCLCPLPVAAHTHLYPLDRRTHIQGTVTITATRWTTWTWRERARYWLQRECHRPSGHTAYIDTICLLVLPSGAITLLHPSLFQMYQQSLCFTHFMNYCVTTRNSQQNTD